MIKEYNENAGRSAIRCDPSKRKSTFTSSTLVQRRAVFATATSRTVTCKRMIELARRTRKWPPDGDLYRHRVPEELYQVDEDPDCLVNLIEHPIIRRVEN